MSLVVVVSDAADDPGLLIFLFCIHRRLNLENLCLL